MIPNIVILSLNKGIHNIFMFLKMSSGSVSKIFHAEFAEKQSKQGKNNKICVLCSSVDSA